ncbi:hypothetical protein BV25DRAFT_1839646 [Artomyces pyxidatus]|uniref:Uncharacterized protein n=1 Tax=Artomyces pyxidatus TaxID=48021 RepID=A0ACB8SV51_9AGAM|nr:hypothetical protein BV25DRAFT_1839646 [Artomyces pyxidatus]
MGRRKSGNPPGRPAWAQGARLTFLQEHLADYQKVEKDGPRTTAFYDSVVRLYLKVFPYKYALQGEPPVEQPDADAAELADVTNEDEDSDSDEVRESRKKIRAEVRRRIVAYYQAEARKLSKRPAGNAEQDKSFVELVKQLVKQPRREQAVHVYSKMFWDSNIKSHFEKEWAKAIAEAGAQGKPMPAEIDVRGRAAREQWKKESAEFQEGVKKAVEERYRVAVEDYERTYVQAPLTEEDRDWALPSAYMFLQPIVDLVARRFGMAVSLLMAGPVPSNNGEIGVLSVHSGKTQGLVQEIWPRYDRAGYKATASSFTGFAEMVFRKDEQALVEGQRQESSLADPERAASPELEHVASADSERVSAADPERVAEQASSAGDVDVRDVAQETRNSPAPSVTSSAPSVANNPLPNLSRRSPPSRAGDAGQGGAPKAVGDDHVHPSPSTGITSPVPAGIATRSASANLSDSQGTATEESPRPGAESEVPQPVAPPAPAKSTSSSSPSPAPAPFKSPTFKTSKWPTFYAKVYDELSSFKLGKDWEELLARHFAFEEARGFQGRVLGSDGRPFQIKLWIKNARRWDKVAIVDIEAFGVAWWRWWASLQPEDRQFADDLPEPVAPSAKMDWSNVAIAGPNGLLSIVCALAMWGLEAVVTHGDVDGWQKAVRDVCAVLQVVGEPPSSSRSSGNDNNDPGNDHPPPRQKSSRRRGGSVEESSRPKKKTRTSSVEESSGRKKKAKTSPVEESSRAKKKVKTYSRRA